MNTREAYEPLTIYQGIKNTTPDEQLVPAPGAGYRWLLKYKKANAVTADQANVFILKAGSGGDTIDTIDITTGIPGQVEALGTEHADVLPENTGIYGNCANTNQVRWRLKVAKVKV